MTTTLNLNQIKEALKNKTPFQRQDIHSTFLGHEFEDDLILVAPFNLGGGELALKFYDQEGNSDPAIICKSSIEQYPEIDKFFYYLAHVKGKIDKAPAHNSFIYHSGIYLKDAQVNFIRPRKKMEAGKQFLLQQLLTFIDKPNKASDKMKILIDEINDLPKEKFLSYSNLIAHQYRTILLLALKYYLQIEGRGLVLKGDGLSVLIKHIENNPIKGDRANQSLIQELSQVQRYKTLTDNVIHDEFTLVNIDEIRSYGTHLKNILSKIYR
ncbi:MAG: hypothetical protein Q8P76_01565 [bacterium]|nr:hypothetical protein [bacterium]